MWVLGCKKYIENHLGLEWLNAVAKTDQPPQGRLVEVEPPRTSLERETFVDEGRQDLLLSRRSKGDREVLVVPFIEPV